MTDNKDRHGERRSGPAPIGTGSGVGIVMGSSIGLMFGLMLFDTWWGLIVGAAAGLIVGAIVDAQRSAGQRGPGQRRQ